MTHPDLQWMLYEASRETRSVPHPTAIRAGTASTARRIVGKSLIALGTRLAPTSPAATSAPAQTTPRPRTSLA